MPGRTKVPTKLLRKKLDEAGVKAHFASLALLMPAPEVRVKASHTAYSTGAETDLADAVDRLLDARLTAVQVRFEKDGVEVCDTIVRVPGGFRLVRIRQP